MLISFEFEQHMGSWNSLIVLSFASREIQMMDIVEVK